MRSTTRVEAKSTEPPMPWAEMRETHISVLFLIGDRVYKVRKPVHLGFVDFRDIAERRRDCEREVEDNRRFAPDVYLGVGSTCEPGGAAEPMVVMRRMPPGRALSNLVMSGRDVSREIDEVAHVMASYHSTARRSEEISEAGTAEAVEEVWQRLFAEARPYLGSVFDRAVDERIRRLATTYLEGRRELFDSRVLRGKILEGHGDLQAEDIFCLDDGPRILDCVEFDDQLRYVDSVADIAFLVMDLERLGAPEAADQLRRRYCELADDIVPDSLFDFYVAQRAYTRAVVSAVKESGRPHEPGAGPDAGPGHGDSLAERLHQLALKHLERARIRLVLVGGLPGTGKSTVADAISAEHSWTLLRTDEIRREIEGPPLGARAGDRYTATATRAVYEAMLTRAHAALTLGESVVLDASWWDAHEREEARMIARETASCLVELRCDCPSVEADLRLRLRQGLAGVLSDATPDVRADMATRYAEWPEASVVDTSGSLEDSLTAARVAIVTP